MRTYKPSRKTNGIDPISWALQCRKINGKPLDHRTQPYLVEPLYESALAMEEEGGRFGFLKGRQAGATTAAITLGLWYMDTKGGTVIHAVPTQTNSDKMNSAVLVPTLYDTEFLNIESGEIFNRSIKTFKGQHSATYVLGHVLGGNMTSDGDQFRGMSSGLIMLDERGQMPPRAVAVISSCADTFQAPVFWNFGSAGYRGDALDKFFRGGTQAEWAIPCETCGKHTVLAPYGSSVDAIAECYRVGEDGSYYYFCEHCTRPIRASQGHWVHGEGPYRSYHVASMNSTFLTAKRLHEKITDPDTNEEALMREVGGLPYGGEGVTIEPAEIRIQEVPQRAHSIIMAVDWGNETSWLVLKSDKDRSYVVATGKVLGSHDSHVTQLFEVAQQYQPDRIAGDFGYSGDRNQKLNDLTGRTFSVLSSLSPRDGNIYEQIQLDRKIRQYKIVRTWVWEKLIGDLRKAELVLGPGNEALKADILDVHPQKAGRASREWTSYEMTAQHFAACLMMAYAVKLRDFSKRRESSVGYGNVVTGENVNPLNVRTNAPFV